MSNKIVVGYDDSVASHRALEFALKDVAGTDTSVVVAHVLEWSPYSFLTPEELEERHKRRGEELARAEAGLSESIAKASNPSDAKLELVIKYGHVGRTLCDIVTNEKATQIYIGRTGQTDITSRLFGSVAGTLAQSAPVPCTIVP